jgi:CMP-N-acetylneuraminic acid synthetase
MKAVCVIPARGGSKRLPRKNVVEFFGKPMIAYSIEAATASKCFERVVVSSDDLETLEIARKYGADPVERKSALASDTARISEVLLDFLDQEEAAGRKYDVIGCLLAAAPLRRAEDVAAVIDLIEPGPCDFAMAVTQYDLPPHQALKLEADGELKPMWPELVDLRDEQVGKLVVDNGSTYAATVAAFRKQRNLYGSPLRGYAMPRERSVDLNSSVDLEIAKVHYRQLNG